MFEEPAQLVGVAHDVDRANASVAVLHPDATLVADGGGKVSSATRPVLGADRVAKFVLGYAGKVHWSESDFQLVTVNGNARSAHIRDGPRAAPLG